MFFAELRGPFGFSLQEYEQQVTIAPSQETLAPTTITETQTAVPVLYQEPVYQAPAPALAPVYEEPAPAPTLAPVAPVYEEPAYVAPSYTPTQTTTLAPEETLVPLPQATVIQPETLTEPALFPSAAAPAAFPSEPGFTPMLTPFSTDLPPEEPAASFAPTVAPVAPVPPVATLSPRAKLAIGVGGVLGVFGIAALIMRSRR